MVEFKKPKKNLFKQIYMDMELKFNKKSKSNKQRIEKKSNFNDDDVDYDDDNYSNCIHFCSIYDSHSKYALNLI